MTPTQRRVARERCEKAEPKPWRVSGRNPEQILDPHGYQVGGAGAAGHYSRIFTVHARTDLPQALDELDRRDAVLGDLQRLAEHGKWDELRRALRGEVERVTGGE